jgi:hypothetical protein
MGRQNKVIDITRIARLRQTRKHNAAAAACIAALLLQALGQAAGRGLVQGERADFMKDRQGLLTTTTTIITISSLQGSPQTNPGPDVVHRGLIDAPALHYTWGDGPQFAIQPCKGSKPIK